VHIAVCGNLQLGGATSRIGDPSGHSSDRQQLDSETVERNLMGIWENVERISRNHQQHFAHGQKSCVSPLMCDLYVIRAALN